MESTVEKNEEQLFNGKTFEEKMKSLSPLYAVLYVNPDATIAGLIEHSFSMGWSNDRVNIFWSGKAYSMLGEHMLDGKKDATSNCTRKGAFVVDLLSEDCPIEIDWLAWFNANSKFFKRNAPFKMKEGFDHSERAKQSKIAAVFAEKHNVVKELVSVRNKAESTYKEKVREAQKALDLATSEVNVGLKKLSNKYQSKAKSIAIEKGKCPKLPDGRYMNTGNCRITNEGIQLKWFSVRPIVYTVSWEELFK